MAGGCAAAPPLFHQAGSRERAGDDGADIDAGALRRRGRSRSKTAVARGQRRKHSYHIPACFEDSLAAR